MLFCILLSLCLYQVIYFLLSNYDKEHHGHSIHSKELQTTQDAVANTKAAQNKSEQNKAFSGSLSNLPPSSIDIQLLYTALNHVLHHDQEAKENAQSPSHVNSKNESPLHSEQQASQTVNSDVTKQEDKSKSLAEIFKQLAPHITLTMLTVSLLGSFIYTTLIAKHCEKL